MDIKANKDNDRKYLQGILKPKENGYDNRNQDFEESGNNEEQIEYFTE